MKVSRQFNVTVILALLLAALMGPSQGIARAGFEQQGGAAELAALGTVFTYQGQLKLDGTPVEGTCDFQFKLWDAASSGSQVGSTLDVPSLAVTGGFFTASLDFGGSAFNGQARWLEVGVRCPAGSGSYTSLGLQSLTPAPYALYSLAADQLDGQHGAFYQNASNLNAGTLGDAYFSAYSDLGTEGYLGDASGDLAQNNGTLQDKLNADQLDGQHGAYYQRRVSSTCTLGSAISAINANGTVECQPFAIFSRNPLDTGGTVGLSADITIGGDGLGLISYYNSSGYHDLKVAHCNNLACNSAILTTVDSTNEVGQYTDITTGGDGFGLISYYDSTNGDLKVAHCTNAACSSFDPPTTVDSGGNVGQYTSIAIGSDGFGLISYYDATNGNLKVAHCTNAACSSSGITIVDSTNDIGMYTSITTGSDGFGLISYYDDTNGNLKVAHCTNAACSSFGITTIDSSADDVGQYASIITGSDGFGLISYYDNTNGDLKVAHCTNLACSSAALAILDSDGDVGYYTDITIGSDGFGLISYYDVTNGDLKAAHCINATCTYAFVSVLDSEGPFGSRISITTGSDGFGLISYYDSNNGDLRVAHCDDVWCAP